MGEYRPVYKALISVAASVTETDEGRIAPFRNAHEQHPTLKMPTQPRHVIGYDI
jgi:hypothetical protein